MKFALIVMIKTSFSVRIVAVMLLKQLCADCGFTITGLITKNYLIQDASLVEEFLTVQEDIVKTVQKIPKKI